MTHSLVLYSKNRTQGTSSEGTLKLNHHINGRYELLEFCMTDGLYNVTNLNNKIYISVNGGGTQTLSLPLGHYSGSKLATEVATLLSTLSGSTFTCSYGSTTGKMTISETTGDTFSLTYGTNTLNTARYLLGFDEVDTTASTSIVSVNVCDLSPDKVIYMGFDEDTERNIQGSELFATLLLSMEGEFGKVMRYKSSQHYSQVMRFTNTPAMLNYRFFNEEFEGVDLNGVEWVMLLRKL